MWETLERLIVIALPAGIGIFCLMDVRRNVQRGYYPTPRGPRIQRQDHPVDFWSHIALKIACTALAFIFAATYLALALTR